MDDEELCDTLANARRGDLEYHINTFGAPESMYTYDAMFGTSGVASKDSGHGRRTRRARTLHMGYQFFSYMRSACDADANTRNLAASWCCGPRAHIVEVSAAEAWQRYKEFKEQQHSGWLRLMREEQWRVYQWSEGENADEG